MNIAFAAFSGPGRALAQKMSGLLDAECIFYDKDKSTVKEWLAAEFGRANAFVFVGAIGIAVRYIAPFIVSKDKDPAVVVVDETGRFAIPILSGHLGGGNALAAEIAEKIGATPVITTATDLYGKFAVDVWSRANGCVIDNVGGIKHVSAAILRDETVGFCSDFAGDGALPEGLCAAEGGPLGIYLTLDVNKTPFELTLKVMPKVLALGVGCKKGTASEALEAFVLQMLGAAGLSIKAVRSIASIDLKKNERCILDLAEKYRLPFVTYTSGELAAVPGDFASSDFVKSVAGVGNVCERAAVAQSGGRLLVGKTTGGGMALAVAEEDWRYAF